MEGERELATGISARLTPAEGRKFGLLVGGAFLLLALLSWQPSEFSTVSLQGRRVRDPDGSERDAAFLKWIFNIGPHGAHPY